MIELGMIAYNAYKISTGGVSAVNQQVLPDWNDLLPEVRKAWNAAAESIRAFCEQVLVDAIEASGEKSNG
jgi:hypothetical protein